MNTIPQELTILNKPIRVVDGLFSLNDLHRASGNIEKNKPALFLRLDKTKDLINEINQSTDVYTAVKAFRGGKTPGTYVCKELVYSYAMWISAKFSLLVIRTFDQLQSQQRAKLESPYVSDEAFEHIKKALARWFTLPANIGRRFIKSCLSMSARLVREKSAKNAMPPLVRSWAFPQILKCLPIK